MFVASLLESAMLVCFGLSWPINAYNSFKARATAKGTSWQFLGLMTLGYIAGISAKLVGGDMSWVLGVYFLNLTLILVNWAIYVRNLMLDRSSRLAGSAVPSSCAK